MSKKKTENITWIKRSLITVGLVFAIYIYAEIKNPRRINTPEGTGHEWIYVIGLGACAIVALMIAIIKVTSWRARIIPLVGIIITLGIMFSAYFSYWLSGGFTF